MNSGFVNDINMILATDFYQLTMGAAYYQYNLEHQISEREDIATFELFIRKFPKNRNYSLIRETQSLKEKLKNKGERQAYFLGLGDVVFPGLLAISAYHNLSTNGLLMGISVLIGTLIGYIALMTLVVKGKPQPGLPLLNTGAILGYILAGFLVFGFPPL